MSGQDLHNGLGGSAQTSPSENSGLGQETGPSGHMQVGPSNGNLLTFRVKPGFQFFYTLPLLLALAILVDALSAPAPDKWLFLLLVLALAAISVPRGWSRVTLTDDRLTLHTPLRRPRTVDLRRLLAVETSARVGAALLLRYRADDQQDRPDSASEAALGLPPLENQATLAEHLRNYYGTAH
ncbi:MAG: hypothetical protein WA040_25795 [Anaerolineae bacterium]